ncbi:MAG: hypothetical protein ACRDXX_16180 [Stackebrandtia sp.]
MNSSRSRATRRRGLLAGGAAAVLAGVAVPVFSAAAETADSNGSTTAAECTVEELKLPDEAVGSNAWVVSSDGARIGGTFDQDSDTTWTSPYVSHDGEVTVIETPGYGGHLRDVNDAGDAVGWWDDGQSNWVFIWAYLGGELVQIPGTDIGQAEGVNNRGDVAGSKGKYWNDSKPFIWLSGADDVVELPLPEDAIAGKAMGVNDDGVVIGYWNDKDQKSHPYMWDADGKGHDLAMPDDAAADAEAMGHDVSGDWAKGVVHDADGVRPIRWNLSGDGKVEWADLDSAGKINSEGWMPGTDSKDQPRVLDADGNAVELPAADAADRSQPYGLSEIDADGGFVAAGAAYPAEGEEFAVVWRCG